VLLAAFAAGFLGAASAAAQEVTFPTATPECGYVGATDDGASLPTVLDVVRAKGVGCSKARRVARKCISDNRVGKWRATPVRFTMAVKRRGGDRVSFRVSSGPVPDCVHKKGLTTPRSRNAFGPFEEPNAYPSKWPPPFDVRYQWSGPVNTYNAFISDYSVGTVDIGGYAHNVAGEVSAVWFEYGTTRDLGTATQKQAPPVRADGGPVAFNVHLSHLKAKTRYYWRAVASVDGATGPTQTAYGALGSFVTNPYPKIADPGRPCESRPAMPPKTAWEITESLAIVCDGPYGFTKGACFPACSNGFKGSIGCNRDFPRNLNSGSWSITIPKIGYQLDVNNLVSYWRSNNSNRFWEFPGSNNNSSGGEVGPVPGWHDWYVMQWAYPFTDTSTNVDFWINCTEKWGGVIDASALAQGEGTDTPSMAAPGTPQNLSAQKSADGGIDATWKAPAGSQPWQMAGYYLSVTGWKPGEPKVFTSNWITPVSATGLSGHIDAARAAVIAKSIPSYMDTYVAVAAISTEGTVGVPATVPWK
jgi:hypothetical protein